MNAAYYIVVLILIYLAVYFLKESFSNKKKIKIKFKNQRFRKMRIQMMNKLNEKDTFFLGTGIPLSLHQYNALRMGILAIIFIFHVVDIKYEANPVMYYSFYIILAIITSPKMTIMKKKTPFARVLNLLEKNYLKKIDLELYNSISQLKNLAIVQKENPMSADFLIEQLIRFTNKSKKVYLHTLSMMREGREEEAIYYFKQTINSKLGVEFANILSKLDYLNPVELKEQLVLFQSSYRNERKTMQLAQQEMLSNIIFLPIVAVAIVILLNFVIITVWLDSLYRMFNL